MTRWDCDVRLWRGVPCTFPAFHDWPPSLSFNDDKDDLVLSSTASLRYVWCPACYTWIPENARHHACTAPSPAPAPAPATEDSGHWEDSEEESAPKASVYVVATEENDDNHMCALCTQRMRLQFIQDIEQWVFMDCVEHEGLTIHEFCRDAVYR